MALHLRSLPERLMAHCRRYDVGAGISGLDFMAMVQRSHAMILSLRAVLSRLLMACSSHFVT